MEISRRGRIDPFIVMEVMEAARRREVDGADIVHMEVGQPGTPAPRRAIEAATAAMASQPLGYTVALGLPELRERIAQHYAEWYGLDIPASRIAVTTGASGGFLLALLALFDVGARVALADPGYPAYRNMLGALDIAAVRMPTGPETRFQPTPGMLANAGRLGRIDGVIVGQPANPTGTALSRDALVDLVETCQRIGAVLISDEIYQGIDYGTRPCSALEISSDLVVINSFSKYFSMTGWRIGWIVAPEPVIACIERLAQNFTICAPHISQVAALAAFDASEELDANVSVYAANRDLLMTELPRAGFTDILAPDGGFYLYANVSDLTDDSGQFCARMLAEAGVAVTPGTDFDPDRGRRFVRFSFAGPTDRMAEGTRRLRTWLRR